MGRGDTSKYDRKEVESVVRDLGFEDDVNNGKVQGKGDHRVWSHTIYKGLKVVIPTYQSLNENEMSNICANVVIIMIVMGMDTSRFKRKEGVEGKFRNAVRNAEKDICILFTTTTKNVLGLREEEEILAYVERTKAELRDKIEQSKQKKKK